MNTNTNTSTNPTTTTTNNDHNVLHHSKGVCISSVISMIILLHQISISISVISMTIIA